jgi:CSLREA domain-containing protein
MTTLRFPLRPLLFAAAACLAVSYPAHAATFTVNATTDIGGSCAPGSPTCTLRAAIQAANATAGASTVTVPAGTYLLSQSTPCAIRTNGDTQIRSVSIVALCITGQLTINGAGLGVTIIDAQQLDRVLVVAADAVAQVNGVTLQDGSMNINSYPFGGNGGGGGINNQGTLSLNSCALLNNTGINFGGGIWSVGPLNINGCSLINNTIQHGDGGAIYAAYGNVSISNSALHGNFASGGGGAILNQNATVSITSSTIDANTALSSSGGGITNQRNGILALTNVTVSGNTAANTAGGVSNAGVMTANNVTIAFNTSQNQIGGLFNNAGSVTLRNSLISGNTGAFGPDISCISYPVISQGYNLIRDLSTCTLTGDLTGNLTGVDPLLTALQDNGGGTFTHALSAGSPAVDAGSPTAPGSGGNACALADQRGILRPLGARCDIGAFERSAALSISGITTNHAADTGIVETFIHGGGFVAGTTVVLRGSGQTDIAGSSPTVDPGGSDLSASFDLTSAALGAWDVVATNPDQTTSTLAGGFIVEVAQAPQLWSTITGPASARLGRTNTFNINYGNLGNADALAVPLTFSVPAGYSLEAYFPITPPPEQTGQVALDWPSVPIDIQMPQAGVTNVALLLPVVPAGFSGSLKFSIVPPVGGPDISFPLTALPGNPMLNPGVDPNAIAQVPVAAQAYALANLGIAIPNSHLPALLQYAANQLTLAVAAGRAAIGSSIGGHPLVYSLGQFGIDVAEFGAANASSLPSLESPKTLGRRPLAPSKSTGPRPLAGAGAGGPGGVDYVCPPGTYENTLLGIFNFCTADHVPVPKLPATVTPIGCFGLENHTLSFDGKRCIPDQQPDYHCDFLSVYLFAKDRRGCTTVPIIQSADPNDKTGPPGVGAQEFEPGGASFPYTIQFENLATATAAAQTVVVTDQLDATTLDLSTFSLGSISFGNYLMNPVAGSKQYTKALDLRPAQNIIVAITAGLNQTTGLVTWTFTSLDPATQQLTTDPTAGFLPPNVTQPQGEAKLLYTINPRANLTTGTTICNQATVVFDVNAPIKTPNWCNTVDVTPPVSHVQSLAPTQSAVSFPVQWSGSDVGSGVADYTIYASDNGGTFVPWQPQTTALQATYPGAPGHSYRFYSIAEDAVLNAEPSKTVADATTAIPSCAADATPQFTVVRSGFHLNTTTHQYQQTVTLTNKTAQTLTGPFALVIDSLSAGSTLFAPAGTTSCAAPSGSPYFTIPPPAGGNWNAGQSVTVGLNFVDPTNAAIAYTLRVLAGTPIR